MKARIHSFESMGTVDGPGIRFITFFQGCVMGCKFCHNRDTWDPEKGKEIELETLVDKVRPMVQFFRQNQGGVTASGGEPLYQPEFVAEFFRICQEELKITTALDTTGCVNLTNEVKRVLEYTDYVLIDIKHTDREKHKELTNRYNDLPLAFNNYIKKQAHLKLWVRHVLVPGETTDEEHLMKLSKYIATLGEGVKRIDILPYHTMGVYKWKELGLEYPLEGVEPASEEQVERAKEILALYNDKSIIH